MTQLQFEPMMQMNIGQRGGEKESNDKRMLTRLILEILECESTILQLSDEQLMKRGTAIKGQIKVLNLNYRLSLQQIIEHRNKIEEQRTHIKNLMVSYTHKQIKSEQNVYFVYMLKKQLVDLFQSNINESKEDACSMVGLESEILLKQLVFQKIRIIEEIGEARLEFQNYCEEAKEKDLEENELLDFIGDLNHKAQLLSCLDNPNEEDAEELRILNQSIWQQERELSNWRANQKNKNQELILELEKEISLLKRRGIEVDERIYEIYEQIEEYYYYSIQCKALQKEENMSIHKGISQKTQQILKIKQQKSQAITKIEQLKQQMNGVLLRKREKRLQSNSLRVQKKVFHSRIELCDKQVQSKAQKRRQKEEYMMELNKQVTKLAKSIFVASGARENRSALRFKLFLEKVRK